METGILHSHTLIAALYTLLVCVLSFFVVTRNKNAFTSLRGKLKWPRMVLEILLLGTGAFLVSRAPDGVSLDYFFKYGVTVLAIVAAIIGFKRFQPLLTTLSVLLLVYVFFVSRMHSWQLRPDSSRSAEYKVSPIEEASPATLLVKGQHLYQNNCQRCHGAKGNAQYRKAPNLMASNKGDEYANHLMQNGLNSMPAFLHLESGQRLAIIAYINSLKGEVQASAKR